MAFLCVWGNPPWLAGKVAVSCERAVGCFLEGKIALRSLDGRPGDIQVTPLLQWGLQGELLCSIAGSAMGLRDDLSL